MAAFLPLQGEPPLGPRTKEAAVIAEIQCLPAPSGDESAPYKHVEAAIDVLRRSGLRFEVGPLGTTIEGDPEAVWPALRAAHEACLRAGATRVVTIVKLFQAAGDEPTMDELTKRYRRGGDGP